MAVTCHVALSEISQVWELYANFSGDPPHDIARGVLDLGFLLLLALTLSFSSSVASLNGPDASRIASNGDRVAQALISIAPLTGFQLGTLNYFQTTFNPAFMDYVVLLNRLKEKFPGLAELRVFASELSAEGQMLAASIGQVRALNVGCFLLILLFVFPFIHRRMDRLVEANAGRRVRGVYVASILASLFLVGLFSAINSTSLSTTFMPATRAVGALPIILGFFCLLTIHLTALVQVSIKRHYPVILLLAAASLVFTSFDLNDNHQIASHLARPTPWEGVSTGQWKGGLQYRLPYLEEAFVDWFQRRPSEEKAHFAGRSYPVFIVAAEGGGAYAAVQSGVFLARLYDRCPALAHHVFAVSGVSGGSVGSAAFVAAANRLMSSPPTARAETCRPTAGTSPRGALESAVSSMLKEDHLAPVIAVALFPDFLQRFLPVAIDTFDRARALESSLAQSWVAHGSGATNPFRQSIRESWDPTGSTPMLLLNTVSVERGAQYAVGPIESPTPFSDDSIVRFRTFFSRGGSGGAVPSSYDVSLGTAASLSARFPGISPPGRHVDRDHPDGWRYLVSDNFVDGGYVDNSGVEVAQNAIDVLQWFLSTGRSSSSEQDLEALEAPTERIEFYLVAIGGESRYTSHWSYTQSWTTGVAAPLVALLNSRATRARIAVDHARHADFELMQVSLPWNFIKPPLGWKLNSSTVDIIGSTIGDSDRCISERSTSLENSFSAKVNSVAPGFVPNLPDINMVSNMFEFYSILNSNHCTARRIAELVR
jgi:hypothetical protein